MIRLFQARTIRHLLVVLLLVAGQSLAFAHGVDEASHPAKTVCDLCLAGHPLGAATGGQAQDTDIPSLRVASPPAPRRPTGSRGPHFLPGQRAPPISR